jgi:branched-chain amino acid transport system permease protein
MLRIPIILWLEDYNLLCFLPLIQNKNGVTHETIINNFKGEIRVINMAIPTIWVSAIVYACEITVLSIGFTLTYLTAKIPNFAHGTYAGVGIYVTFTIAKILNLSPYIAFPLSFIIGGVLSVLIYLVVIGTLSRMGGGAIVLTISTLAIQIFLTAAISIYAFWIRDVYRTYTMYFIMKDVDFRVGPYPGIFPIAVAICVVTVVLLHYMLTKTKTGVAMRATSEDPELSSVLGIDTNRIQIYSWFLTGGLACLAGAMLPLWFMCMPTTGASIITSIMAGSLLGGFMSIYGAIVGGFGVGLSEILVTTWLGNIKIGGERLTWIGEYRPLIPMFIMVAVLLIEPNGLYGVKQRFEASEWGSKLFGMFKREV